MLKTLAAFFLCLGVAVAQVNGQSWTSGRADGHAPIGVMGDHQHEAGEWMVSFRYMRMAMEGNGTGH